MTSKRRQRRRQCGNKIAYPSKEAARLAIWKLSETWRGFVRPYTCPWCGRVHIGRPPKRRSR